MKNERSLKIIAFTVFVQFRKDQHGEGLKKFIEGRKLFKRLLYIFFAALNYFGNKTLKVKLKRVNFVTCRRSRCKWLYEAVWWNDLVTYITVTYFFTFFNKQWLFLSFFAWKLWNNAFLFEMNKKLVSNNPA